ncbi:NAD(P)-dependent dehydrogenase, short-chain alcohol dehydrogenase family [Abditibacterium utsteinense]|uniref:NAD(P)-dependent dehydrogenase, short-chain alcohol dehydrogenase family n=1 Tax=Abditibacterium utsteinense TaxID=1960156 RepID=A0A2S8SWZ3_9BACT|nr:SDR family oxidoreductase [Abditibacterium utsteinense]PQV65304.1 NAD(P)-dependent dehydrogenase, short-chain alcohol dehydrogenase family [Abditibacterium utsteinense]
MKKTALITGANKGIGFAAAQILAQQGFTVFIGARDAQRGEDAVQNLTGKGLEARFVALDVADDASVASALKTIENEFDALDVLVNNAGINIDGQRGLLEVTADEYRHTFETNVLGVLRVSQAFWPLLQKSDSPRVINVSSGLGRLFDMTNESPAYSVSKTAVNALTRQFAGLGQEKVSVNSICPGWVRTDMGGEGTTRTPEEGAAIIVKLATMENPPTGKYLNDAGEIGW